MILFIASRGPPQSLTRLWVARPSQTGRAMSNKTAITLHTKIQGCRKFPNFNVATSCEGGPVMLGPPTFRIQNSIKEGSIMHKTKLLIAGMTTAALASCATIESGQGIDITTYKPVIDAKGMGYNQVKLNMDLQECRQIGYEVKARYDAQRKRETDAAWKKAALGALAGAAVGAVVDKAYDKYDGEAITAGALAGAGIGAAVGSDGVDYTRQVVKFGPTSIIDRCMANRGYVILSAEGYGG